MIWGLLAALLVGYWCGRVGRREHLAELKAEVVRYRAQRERLLQALYGPPRIPSAHPSDLVDLDEADRDLIWSILVHGKGDT